MTNNQTPGLETVTQQHEPFFLLRMFGIIDQATVFIKESSLRFLERDAVLFDIRLGFAALPRKTYIAHSIILAIQH